MPTTGAHPCAIGDKCDNPAPEPTDRLFPSEHTPMFLSYQRATVAQPEMPLPPCPRCGHENPSGTKFCRRCGTSLLARPEPAPAPPAGTPPPRSSSAPPGSLQASLARLGLRPTCGQLAGFGVAVVFGLALARLLPLAFPIIYPVLSLVFIDLLHTTPDAFNTMAMTCLTCTGSFGLAFGSALLFGRRGRQHP